LQQEGDIRGRYGLNMYLPQIFLVSTDGWRAIGIFRLLPRKFQVIHSAQD
jgi:hypothetical protein